MGSELSVTIAGTGKRIALGLGPAELSLRGKAVQFVLALITTDFRAISRAMRSTGWVAGRE